MGVRPTTEPVEFLKKIAKDLDLKTSLVNVHISQSNRYVMADRVYGKPTTVMIDDQTLLFAAGHETHRIVRYTDLFVDYLNPTEDELTLFEIEFGVPYPMLEFIIKEDIIGETS